MLTEAILRNKQKADDKLKQMQDVLKKGLVCYNALMIR